MNEEGHDKDTEEISEIQANVTQEEGERNSGRKETFNLIPNWKLL